MCGLRRSKDHADASPRRKYPTSGGVVCCTRIAIWIAWATLPGVAVASAQTEPRCADSGQLRVCVEPAGPVEGEMARILVTDAGLPAGGVLLEVTYRPNSAVARTVPLGQTDQSGRIEWRPAAAGLATLAATAGDRPPCELNVAVRFRGVPVGGIVVMLMAGFVLFGGNSYSFAKTFGRT